MLDVVLLYPLIDPQSLYYIYQICKGFLKMKKKICNGVAKRLLGYTVVLPVCMVPLVAYSDVAIHNSYEVDINAGLSQAYWKPSDDGDVLSFNTEGMRLFQAEAGLLFQGDRILSLKYERPTNGTPGDERVFVFDSQNGDDRLEKLDLSIGLLQVFKQPENPNWLNRLLSPRLDFQKKLYNGNVSADRDFMYAPSSSVKYDNGDGSFGLTDTRLVRKGDEAGFTTESKTTELTFPVVDAKGLEFRVGAYQSEWSRPSSVDDAFSSTTAGTPLYMETDFKTRGLVLKFQQSDDGRPGFNANGFLRYSFVEELNNPVRDYSSRYDGDYSLAALEVGLDVWYNWYFNGANEKRGIYARVGGNFDYRRWIVSYNGKSQDEPLEKDMFYYAYAKIGYRF